MVVVIGLALGLLVGGVVVAWLSPGMKREPLVSIVYWVGVILAVIGIILLVAPVLSWISAQLRSALGA